MANLDQVSLARAQRTGDMPVFPGDSFREQLSAGRAEARAALLKYVPDFRFDVEQARDVMSKVDGWMTRTGNQERLAEVMESNASMLPRELCTQMGSAVQVQQWIVSNFTVAAAGLGPWQSGRVARLAVDPNSELSEQWATEDASMRLNIFGMIVMLDRSGELQRIFNPPADAQDPCGVDGIGAVVTTGTLIIIMIAAVVFAAIVVYLVLDSKRVQRNNDLLEKLCLDAQRDGDKETVRACVEALKEIQQERPFGNIAGELTKVALVLGGGYLLIAHGMPLLLEKFSKPPGKKARA